MDTANLIALISLIFIVLGQSVALGWWASGQSSRTKACEDAVSRLAGDIREVRTKLDERTQAENILANALSKLTATVEQLQKSVDRLIEAESAQAISANPKNAALDEFKQFFELMSTFDRLRAPA